MKVPESQTLTSLRPLLRELLDALLKEYEYASVLAVDSIAKKYSCSKAGLASGQDALNSGKGFVARVYDKEGCCEYSFNELTASAIPHIIDDIREKLSPITGELPEGVEPGDYIIPKDEPLFINESTEYEVDPDELGDEKILEKLKAIHELGLKYDDRIIECMAMFSYRRFSKIFLSREKDLEQNVMWSNGAVAALSKKDEAVKNSFRGFSNLGGAELMDEMEKHVADECKVAIELLDAVSIEPGEYECICTPEVTGMIVHEAFGHGVEMDMFVKDRACAKNYIGQQVASPLVTMHDGAAAVKQTATYFFDDEGTPSQDTVVIDKGILTGGFCDARSAEHLGISPTGNGRRESYERKAYTRMTNTWFEGGTSTPEEMIASVKYGLLLEEPTSGMEDPKNWGIQCMVSFAREIKDGKFTGRIFSPIVLTGYVPDLLKSITMMSNDVELSGSGFCGKGYKEWVKVSDGGPWMKARIRLG